MKDQMVNVFKDLLPVGTQYINCGSGPGTNSVTYIFKF